MVLPYFEMAGDSPTDAEVLAALRQAGRQGFPARKRCLSDMLAADVTIENVCEWVADCQLGEIVKHEPDDKPLERPNDYIVELEIDVEGTPFYVMT